ncbi:hypothetical protein BN14_02570 [Rhizoctonia solani AG-1 IB]|uniref:Uncharacterized protein n=1 Tax=Thanatephorus cucumeris (strain AG1-IB / isolate 7/3/14) TaxID=1108050 RepID=M5BQ77_THACB|nr:hypothetical protein BN14_02570 [Rhizoctonia solani AG-1 IB]
MWIEDPISDHVSREWAFGGFTILMLGICTPALLVLHFIASRHPNEIPQKQAQFILKAWDGIVRMDPVGLVLFTAGLALVDYNTEVWWGGDIEVFPVFALWEIYLASFPIMPKWMFQKRGVLLAIMITFFYRIAIVTSMLVYGYYRNQNWQILP